MKKKQKIIILGAGGHARVLIDTLDDSCEIIGIADMKEILDLPYPYLGTDEAVEEFDAREVKLVNGVGSVRLPRRRRDLFERFKRLNFAFASVIHPSAVVSKNAELGEGVQIMANAVVNTGTILEENVIVNTAASIDHDCRIGAHSHVAPGVTISGIVHVGHSCHIGTGANVIQEITIGDEVLVAAGETVRNNVPSGMTVFSRERVA